MPHIGHYGITVITNTRSRARPCLFLRGAIVERHRDAAPPYLPLSSSFSPRKRAFVKIPAARSPVSLSRFPVPSLLFLSLPLGLAVSRTLSRYSRLLVRQPGYGCEDGKRHSMRADAEGQLRARRTWLSHCFRRPLAGSARISTRSWVPRLTKTDAGDAVAPPCRFHALVVACRTARYARRQRVFGAVGQVDAVVTQPRRNVERNHNIV